jgi:hypothetical protein
MSTRRLAIGLMSATALSFAFSGTASAEVEAKAVVDALIAQFAKQGLAITAAASELDGDNVVVKDLSISFPDAEAFKIKQVVLEEVSEEEGGGYIIGTISAPETTIEDGDSVVEFGGASINGYVLPSPTEADPIKALGLYDSIEIGEVTVSHKDEEVFRMDGMTASMSEYVKGQAFTFDASVDGLWGDLSKVEDAEAKKTIEAFGYKEVTGDVKMKGSWNPTDGRMTISEGAYNINNVGRLNMTMDLSGYTPELIKGLQEMNKTMAGQDESAKGLAMLGLLQQLNFVGMTVRFDDASITNKVIDYAAKQAGQDRTAIINQTKGVLPFALAQLQDPDFAAKVTAAANAFIDNPRNLEIKAIPVAPVPFAVLAATGSTTPQALIKQLNVTVTANQ